MAGRLRELAGLAQDRQQLLVVRSDFFGQSRFMLIGKAIGPRKQAASIGSQLQRVRAPVIRRAPAGNEFAILQAVEQPYQARAFDAQRCRKVGLRQPRIFTNHREHRKLSRSDVQRRQRIDEIAKNPHLKPPDMVADPPLYGSEPDNGWGLLRTIVNERQSCDLFVDRGNYGSVQ